MYEVIGIELRDFRKEGHDPVVYVTLHCKRALPESKGKGECVKTFNYKSGSFGYSANIGDIILPELDVFGKYVSVVDIHLMGHKE